MVPLSFRSLPGKFHGQRRLVGYSPWGHKESDSTEWLSMNTRAWCFDSFNFYASYIKANTKSNELTLAMSLKSSTALSLLSCYWEGFLFFFIDYAVIIVFQLVFQIPLFLNQNDLYIPDGSLSKDRFSHAKRISHCLQSKVTILSLFLNLQFY